MRGLIGLQQPFPVEMLRQLYGARDHYLQRFNQRIDRMVADRWITHADAEKLQAEETEQAPHF